MQTEQPYTTAQPSGQMRALHGMEGFPQAVIIPAITKQMNQP